LRIAEQLLGILAGCISATPIAHSTRMSRSEMWNGADITSWIRSAAVSASSIPRRSETRTPNSLPPVRARTSPPRSADISRLAKVISKLVAGEAPHALVDPAEAEHVDDQHRMLALALRLFAGPLDGLGEGEAVGKAGQAVAKHFRAQSSLRLHLDGPVDEAHQAAPHPLAVRQRRELDPQIAGGNPLAVRDVELADAQRIGEIVLEKLGDRPAFRHSASFQSTAVQVEWATASSKRVLCASTLRDRPGIRAPMIAAAIGRALRASHVVAVARCGRIAHRPHVALPRTGRPTGTLLCGLHAAPYE
jgi:hypothetical protein